MYVLKSYKMQLYTATDRNVPIVTICLCLYIPIRIWINTKDKKYDLQLFQTLSNVPSPTNDYCYFCMLCQLFILMWLLYCSIFLSLDTNVLSQRGWPRRFTRAWTSLVSTKDWKPFKWSMVKKCNGPWVHCFIVHDFFPSSMIFYIATFFIFFVFLWILFSLWGLTNVSWSY